MSIIERLLCSVAAPVSSRASKKVVAFIGGVALAGSVGACATGPQGPSMPVRYDLPSSYQRAVAMNDPQRPSDAEIRRFWDSRLHSSPQSPVAPSPSWKNNLGPMAAGAGLGAVGGMMANRAMAGETAAAVAGGAKAVEGGEAVSAGRAVGAVRAGAAAVGAAEAVEGAEAAEILEVIISRLAIFLL